jgi:hypothetical protein
MSNRFAARISVRNPTNGSGTLGSAGATGSYVGEADVHFLGLERPFLGRNEDQLCIRASPNLA